MSDGNAPLIELIALGQDEEGQLYRILAFTDAEGWRQELAVPVTAAAGGGQKSILTRLAERQFLLPHGRARQNALLNSIDEQPQPDARVTVIRRPGWTGDIYVIPGRTFGAGPADVAIDLSDEVVNPKFRTNGTLRHWQDHVMSLAFGNSLAMLSIMAAFAGPILVLVHGETGAVSAVGSSSLGKSISTMTGGSVYGARNPTDPYRDLGFAERWLTTANALDTTLAAHNHGFLCLDDTGYAASNPKGAGEILDACYRISSGEEKARHGDHHRRGQWLVMVLSTSEKTLDQLAMMAHRTVELGQRVRFTDIMADAGKGYGAFEDLHGDANSATFADRLHANSLEYHGVVGQKYLQRLAEDVAADRGRLVRFLSDAQRAYLEVAKPQTGPERRIAKRFATIFAAGVLANKYGLISWSRKECGQAVLRCHRRMVPLPAIPRDPVQAVRNYIRENEVDFLDIDDSTDGFTSDNLRRAKGFIGKHRGEKVYMFTVDRFDQDVCSGYNGKTVFAALMNQHLVATPGSSTGRSIKKDFPAPLDEARVICVRGTLMI